MQAAIDKGDAILTFINITTQRMIKGQMITKTFGHAIVVVGYDANGKMIYFDPAKGHFLVAEADRFDIGIRVILKDKKG